MKGSSLVAEPCTREELVWLKEQRSGLSSPGVHKDGPGAKEAPTDAVGGGYGRTGSRLICYLVSLGYRLRVTVEEERVLEYAPSGERMVEGSRQEELEREGWVRQFTADEPRLSEAVELYESLGFEVHLEPVTPDDSAEECQICFQEGERYKTIYTRPKRKGIE